MDASQVLGSPQVAGLIVVPKGFGASTSAGDIGTPVVTTSLREMMERSHRRGQQALSEVVLDTPRFSGYGLLALTAQELALVSGPGHAVHKLIARMPRSEIVFADRLGLDLRTHLPPRDRLQERPRVVLRSAVESVARGQKNLSPLKAEQQADPRS